MSDQYTGAVTRATLAQEDRRVEVLRGAYPVLAAIQEPAWLDVLERARTIQVPAGRLFLKAGDCCDGFVLLLEGAVRVYQLSNDGRTMTLYRVNPGEICILSLNSLIQKQPFTAFAETESAVYGLCITSQDFLTAMRVSEIFPVKCWLNWLNTIAIDGPGPGHGFQPPGHAPGLPARATVRACPC